MWSFLLLEKRSGKGSLCKDQSPKKKIKIFKKYTEMEHQKVIGIW